MNAFKAEMILTRSPLHIMELVIPSAGTGLVCIAQAPWLQDELGHLMVHLMVTGGLQAAPA